MLGAVRREGPYGMHGTGNEKEWKRNRNSRGRKRQREGERDKESLAVGGGERVGKDYSVLRKFFNIACGLQEPASCSCISNLRLRPTCINNWLLKVKGLRPTESCMQCQSFVGAPSLCACFGKRVWNKTEREEGGRLGLGRGIIYVLTTENRRTAPATGSRVRVAACNSHRHRHHFPFPVPACLPA